MLLWFFFSFSITIYYRIRHRKALARKSTKFSGVIISLCRNSKVFRKFASIFEVSFSQNFIPALFLFDTYDLVLMTLVFSIPKQGSIQSIDVNTRPILLNRYLLLQREYYFYYYSLEIIYWKKNKRNPPEFLWLLSNISYASLYFWLHELIFEYSCIGLDLHLRTIKCMFSRNIFILVICFP
jgi:hypothetical protein